MGVAVFPSTLTEDDDRTPSIHLEWDDRSHDLGWSYSRWSEALDVARASGVPRGTVKAAAIDGIWRDRVSLLASFHTAPDKIAFCESLPWIGGITKYHLAKNFGAQVAKPDVHLVRLAATFNTTPQELCEVLAQRSGLKVATIDTLLWRAAANGILDTRTGAVKQLSSDCGG